MFRNYVNMKYTLNFNDEPRLFITNCLGSN